MHIIKPVNFCMDVIFANESKFNLFLLKKFSKKKAKYRDLRKEYGAYSKTGWYQDINIVWGCIRASGVENLVVIESAMT